MAARTDRFRLEDLSEDETRALLYGDLSLFVQIMYRQTKSAEGLIWHPYLDLICSRLQAVAEGRLQRLIITMPPRHLKSFTVSTALPAFLLGRHPDQHVMCVSYGQDLAKEFARDTQAIMLSDTYRAVFGEVLLGARQPLHALRTRFGGVRRATSLDGTATGLGGNLLIFDDPQKPGETLSDAVRRSTNATYENTFVSRSNDPEKTRIIVVMQRLHEDDFVSHVLARGGEWELLNLPAIAEQDEKIRFKTALGWQTYRRHEGEPLHPGRMSRQTLDGIRQTVGEGLFATQYQQRPAPAGGGLVQVKWFSRYAPADLPAAFDRIVQSWDTANTVAQWSDYSVCTTWGVKGKKAYLLHVYRNRLIYPDLKRAVLDQARLHEATVVFVEDHASGTQLIQELRQEGYGKLRPVKAVRDKKTRMINQTALIESGLVHVPAEAPWLEEYLYELAVFPKGKFDDQVDSTSQALEGINSWEGGSGLLEFIRQDIEARQAKDEEVRVLRGPPAVGLFLDIEGGEHRLGPDGLFRIPRRYVGNLLNTIGWSDVTGGA